MNKNQLQGNELALIILISIATLIFKIHPFVIYLWNNFKWHGLFILIASVFTALLFKYIKNSKSKEGIYIGKTKSIPIYLPEKERTTHAQVIGSTGTGKTESVILPWIIQDIKNGRGVLIVDGKSDSFFLNKLYAYTSKYNRKDDFRLFSLANFKNTYSFNPLRGKSSIEVSEKVFSTFNFESEYYKNIQYKIFCSLVELIKEYEVPTFREIHRLLTNSNELCSRLSNSKNDRVISQLNSFINLKHQEREERISGLEAQLSHFALGEEFLLFEETENLIDINFALENNQILYFQLPTMLYPFLASATGKMLLQSLQSAIARRHLSSKKSEFFSIYLDDFQDYIYEGFGALLNKSRSANIGMVFSHQSLGDLNKVSSAFEEIVLTNTNIKVIMRTSDPNTCEYFAKSFGTKSGQKITSQTSDSLFGINKTGMGTLRDVEEYIFHPNIFKKLSVGQGILSIPVHKSIVQVKVKFPMICNIETKDIPCIEKTVKGKVVSDKVKQKSSKIKMRKLI